MGTDWLYNKAVNLRIKVVNSVFYVGDRGAQGQLAAHEQSEAGELGVRVVVGGGGRGGGECDEGAQEEEAGTQSKRNIFDLKNGLRFYFDAIILNYSFFRLFFSM